MSTTDTEALAAIIKRAVLEALSEGNTFPLYTVGEVAALFRVSKNTVLTWRRNGLIKAHAHVVSGCSWRWLFTHSDLLAFFKSNFSTPDDWDDWKWSKYDPRSTKAARAAAMQRLLAERRLFSRTHSRRRENQ